MIRLPVHRSGAVNAAQLGDWAPSAAVAMSAASYTSQNPLWQVTISLPAGLSFEYKYIITGSDGSITWETGDNNA